MPVGAIIGAGVVTAGATVAVGSKNAGAINKATEASTAGNAESVALQRDVYGQNKATLQPWQASGLAANGQINALLGLDVPQAQSVPTPQPNALSQFGLPGPTSGYGGGTWNMDGSQATPVDYGAYVRGNPDVLAEFQRVGKQFGNDPAAFGQFHYQNYGQQEGRALPGSQATGNALAPATTPATAQSAFDQFRKSTGYQFRLGEGMNALNSGYAGKGVIRSGAAMKGIQEYGQNFASGEFGNYMNLLQTQQNVGAGAATAQAGVAQNFANNVTNLHTANSNALASGAVARAQNGAGMISGLAGIANSTVGSLNALGAFK